MVLWCVFGCHRTSVECWVFGVGGVAVARVCALCIIIIFILVRINCACVCLCVCVCGTQLTVRMAVIEPQKQNEHTKPSAPVSAGWFLQISSQFTRLECLCAGIAPERMNERRCGWMDGWTDGAPRLACFRNSTRATRVRVVLVRLSLSQRKRCISETSAQGTRAVERLGRAVRRCLDVVVVVECGENIGAISII